MTSIVVGPLVPNGIHNSDLGELNKLLREFSPAAQELRMEDVRAIAQDDFMFVARQDGQEIVGMTTLIVYRKPTGLVGVVEDVIVTERWRGKDVGKELMETLIRVAKSRKLKHLFLTSNQQRVAAHGLYRSLGFEVKDTTCFVLKL